MTRLRIFCLSLGTALMATAATVGLATAYPKLAIGISAGGTLLLGLGTNLPQAKVTQ